MESAKDQLVNWVVGSLEVEPENWTFDHYNANHTSGLKVWIANGTYGLEIVSDGARFGGVTGFSILFGWLSWRGRIIRAVREAALKKMLAKRFP